MGCKPKIFVVFFILIAVITVAFENVSTAEASVSPTQYLNTSWILDTANGFAPPSASDALDSDDGAIWIDNGDTSAQWIEFSAAPDEGLFSFDLTALTLGKYQSDWSMTFTIVGTRTDNSTTAPVTLSWPDDGSSSKTFSGADLTGLTGLTKFKVSFGDGTFPVWYAEFRQFTIANQMTSGNAAPVVSNLSDVTFQENTVNAAPQQIDPDITVTDSDSADFDGGQVTVSYTAAGLPEDQLAVGNIGDIFVSGTAVNYAGVGQIGTVGGGGGGAPLVINLNANATPARVTGLLRALTYQNISNEPASYRTISITVSDGDGGTSAAATARIAVSGQAEAGVESPALIQNLSYPGWVDDLNNGFAIIANGGVTLSGDASLIWISGGETGPASLTISAAEQFAGGMFDLAGMAFDLNGSSTYTVTVTGHKAGGGTVTADANGSSTAAFNAMDLSAMTGLLSFDVEISGTGNVSNLGLASFTIANPQAYTGNQAPSITGLDDVTFQENTVNAAPQQIDPDITVTDSDSADFDGGRVTVSYTAAGLPEDQLAVGNIGDIFVSGTAVNYAGVGQIGTVGGGGGGAPLVIDLNANATPARVTGLLRALTYQNISNEPASYRTISITVSDGDGGTSAAATARIAVSGQAEAGVESPALLQNLSYPGWVDDLNNGFAIIANGGVTLSGNASLIWISGGETGPASLTVSAAEQFAGGMFDLAGMTFDLDSGTYTVTVTGHRTGGGTVTASVLSGSNTADFNAINLTGMTQLIFFDVEISGTGNVSNLGLDSFTIANPQAVNLPPVFTSAAGFSVPETARADNTVLHDVQAHDGDGGVIDANLTYSIAGGTGQTYFSIDSATGEIKLTAAGEASLDYESVTGYTLIVRADDGQAVNNISEQTITVSVENAAPAISAGQSFTVSETAADGTSVGTVAVTGDQSSVTFSITSGNNGNAFAIDAASGEITVNNAGAIDFEAAPSFTLTIQASDGTSNSSQDVTINVEDVAPAISAGQSFTVSETAADGTSVGTVAVTGDHNSIVFSIQAGNDDGVFAMNSSTGEISVADSANLDYETAALYVLTIRVSDGTTNSDATVTVNVENINEPPTVSLPASVTVIEDTASQIIGISIADADAGANDVIAAFTVNSGTLSASSAGGVTVGGTATALTLTGTVTEINDFISSGYLSYTTALNDISAVTLGVTVNDQGHTGSGGAQESGTANVTINVNPVNDPPSFTKGPDQVVAENSGPQEVIGWATDISSGPADESTQMITFIVSSNDNPGLFSVQPQVSPGGTLTYTPAADITGIASVTVFLADNGGTDNGGADSSAPQSFTIKICAADGSGTMTVAPAAAAAGQTGLTLVFTYTATAGGLENGAVSIDVPDGWSPPGTNTVAPGYTTASAGTVGVSGRTLTVTGLTLAGNNTIDITYGDKSGGGPGTTAASTVGASTWQARSSTTAAGSLTDLDISPQVTIGSSDTDPAQSSLAVDETTRPADNAATATVTVTLRDAFGNPVSGHTVILDQGAGHSTIEPAGAVTDVGGLALFTVKNHRAETVVYRAVDTTPEPDVAVNQTVQVTFEPGVTVDPAAGSAIEGGTVQYALALVSQPTADVVVSVTSDGQLNVDRNSLTFNGTNYNTPQTVTVTAIDNRIADGVRTGVITHAASSADPAYHGIPVPGFHLDITDNDSPDIIINQSGSPIQITEGGASGAYTMVLATQPADSVTVYVYGGGQVSVAPEVLEFTPGNWDVPREVTVTAVDDAVAEGPHTATITHTVYSTDPDYNGFNIPDITVDITDNDSPGISIDRSGAAVVTEGGGDYTYAMVLTTRPYANVKISISGDAQLDVDPGEWTFTLGNWNTPKTVRVWALDDDVTEGDHTGTVSHSVYSADQDYHNYAISPITLLIIDNDASTNAYLSGLVPSIGTLAPAFDPATTNYSLSVAYSVNSITVTPSPTDSNATVAVNGEPVTGGQVSPPISLYVGANSINIVVTAQDGISTKMYTITVNRAASSGGRSGTGGNTQPQGGGTSMRIKASTGGKVSLDNIAVEIPANTLPADATVSIKELSQAEANRVVPRGLRVKMAGAVYEITTTGERHFGDNYITIRLAYDPAMIAGGEFPAVHYYDETQRSWIKLETQLVQEGDRWYAVTRVNHLTKFAVFSTAAEPEASPPEDKKVVTLTVGQTLAGIDGSLYTLDAPPYVDRQSQRALVPVRFISEALGAEVKWDSATRQVTVEDGGRIIVLTLGSPQVLVDGAARTMDCAPELLPPGRVFVPLRFVSETLGAQVDYDSATGQITLTRQRQ